VSAVLPDRWLNELHRTSRSLRLVRGAGAYVWDDEDRRYLDLTSSGASTLLGHNHPQVVEAMGAQLQAFTTVPPGFEYDLREELLEALSFIIPVPLTHVSFTSSGSAAIDLAIAWVASVSDRRRLITMRGSDHGSSIARRATGSAGRRFEAVEVAFDDLEALDAALGGSTAAVVVEPVQVESGVRVPRDGYLAAVAERCRRAGALLVVDEVSSALRMGPTLASSKSGVEPDIVCLGSSLANGLPFGVAAVGPSIARRARLARSDPDDACPPLVCAAANATIRAALSPTVRALAELNGERLQVRLRALRLAEIREVRGCASVAAVETSLSPSTLLRHLERRGIVALPGGPGSIRMLAPLILDRREVDGIVETLAAIILASRPPRRRTNGAPRHADLEVGLPGRAARQGAPARR